MGKKISDRAIRVMPYESRIVQYNREKNDLFLNNPGKSPDWLEDERRKLQKKWRV